MGKAWLAGKLYKFCGILLILWGIYDEAGMTNRDLDPVSSIACLARPFVSTTDLCRIIFARGSISYQKKDNDDSKYHGRVTKRSKVTRCWTSLFKKIRAWSVC